MNEQTSNKKPIPTGPAPERPLVYVVFLSTEGSIGRLIRFFTWNLYNHVALSFEPELYRMYSFARYQRESPLVGGYVVEYPGQYRRSRCVPMKVAAVPVDPERYRFIKETISDFSARRSEMIYNSFGAVVAVFHLRLHLRDSFTCIDFLNHLFGYRDVKSIFQLEKRFAEHIFYEGDYLEYVRHCADGDIEGYFTPLTPKEIVKGTCRHFRRLVRRRIA